MLQFETKNFLKSLDVSNVFYEGNLKLIVNIYENEINNVNENLLLKKNFGLLQVLIKTKRFFVSKLI